MSSKNLSQCFSEALGITQDSVSDDLSYNTIPEWDSIGHMAMVAALESNFNIMLEIEDIIKMSSFGKIKEILKKYGVPE